MYPVVDGGWSSWRLGPCSKTCGGGIQNYTRVCDDPKPSCGGEECDGPSSYTFHERCNDFSCSGEDCTNVLPLPPFFIKLIIPSVYHH